MTEQRTELLLRYIAEDSARAKALFSLDTKQAAQQLRAEGFDFTPEELAEFAESYAELISPTSDELSANALDAVAGGGMIGDLWRIIKSINFTGNASIKNWSRR